MGKRLQVVNDKGIPLNPGRTREVAGLALCGLSLFCLIALGGMAFGNQMICGKIGYSLAWFLHLLFGQVSIFTMAFLTLWGVLMIAGKGGRSPQAKVLGIFGFSLFLAILVSYGQEPLPSNAMPHGAGGELGAFLGIRVFNALGFVGSLLVLSLGILISLLLATDYMFVDLFRPGAKGAGKRPRVPAWLVAGIRRGWAFLLALVQRGVARLRRRRTGTAVKSAPAGQAEQADAGSAARTRTVEKEEPAATAPAGRRTASGTPRKAATKAEAPAARPKTTPKPAPARPKPLKIHTSASRRRPPRKPASGGTKRGAYYLPPEDLLSIPPGTVAVDEEQFNTMKEIIERKLLSFRIEAEVVSVSRGPAVTLFELKLAEGVKVNQITARDDDLAMALAAQSLRVVAPIPGKGTVGVEVPNTVRETVVLRDLLPHCSPNNKKRLLPTFLAKDVMGEVVISDLTAMPHLLVSGATGSGKSVCINSILISFLMTRTPEEVGLILVDPKMVELQPYDGIPHLMAPIVTDMTKVPGVLQWAVDEMEKRYQLLSQARVRKISDYNKLSENELRESFGELFDAYEKPTPRRLRYVVIVIDEFADLMAVASKDVELLITRLAQKSRAVGLHVIMATQHPSREVVTGIIKANLPTRISFKVTQGIYSRVVLDSNGAEKLIGNGDMLFLAPGTSSLKRAQGVFVSDTEIKSVVDFWIEQGKPEYEPDLLNPAAGSSRDGSSDEDRDDRYYDAVRIVLGERRGSATLLQRMLKVGYTRASRYIELMEEDGLVGPHVGSKSREILMKLEEWEELQRQREEWLNGKPVGGTSGEEVPDLEEEADPEEEEDADLEADEGEDLEEADEGDEGDEEEAEEEEDEDEEYEWEYEEIEVEEDEEEEEEPRSSS